MEAAMEAAAWMEAAVIVAAREAVLVAEIADATSVTVLADIAVASECNKLTVAGRRGRLEGGELSCGGLEGGEGSWL
jgi:hypothetical protein